MPPTPKPEGHRPARPFALTLALGPATARLALGALLVALAACSAKPAEPPARRTVSAQTPSDKPAPALGEALAAEPDAAPHAPQLTSSEPERAYYKPTDEQRALLSRGKQALLSGQDDAAIAAFEELQRTEPVSGERVSAAIALADLYRQRGRLAEAIPLLEQIQAKVPPTAELLYVLARLYKEQRRREEAILTFQEAVRLNPLLLQSHIEVGGLLLELGEDERSAASFKTYETMIYKYSKLLEDPLTHPTDKQKIALAFSFLPDDRALEALHEALLDRDRQVRISVAEALGEVGGPSSLPRLRELRAALADDPGMAEALDRAIAKIEASSEAQEDPNPDDHAGPNFAPDAGPP